ncbi:3-oxoacyl-[acyl-carrier protein] reductase [Bacillus mesophilus]|uniref:SDR family oxidoreductase n=1 Tax=Bacillus mesophilus TaxID=1808955 RepID=A0A6M0Q4M4_9BACI|nr:SDR family NAD(P)-dependent oxidoreductase [Bacillus mesophilus]MBM7661134.1 3-oxoacyl-[acyl-carrier protein] reductase [Bacillus mesophilus]NEY71337.1 SDR family oxidoreductase [Bacillus mesophilus]
MIQSTQSTIFTNKVVIVTGAAHGIGKGICLEFLKQGATVIGLDILQEELTQVKEEACKKYGNFIDRFYIEQVDLTLENKVYAVIQQIIEKHEKVDVLVNNAGGVCGQVNQPIDDVSYEEWKKIFEINLDASFFMTKAVAPHMKQRGYGRIINISSGAGRSTSLTGIQAYASAKAGQIGFTRQMAQELGSFGITVNNVAPGFVISNPSTEKQWNRMSEEQQKALIQSISVKRLGKPEDIAYAVLFFASDAASYISGQIISVDGGQQLF